MNIPTPVTAPNVGREDRVVRGCIALSLILLGGFTLVGAERLTLVTAAFVLLGGYFGWTAAVGSDPGYHRAGIDTRTDAELGEDAAGYSEAFGSDPLVSDDTAASDVSDTDSEPVSASSPR